MTGDAEGTDRCALCDRRIVDVDGGDDALHLEVSRIALEGLGYVDASFCTQAHAAEWLARPLPDPEPDVAPPASGWERLVGVVLVVGAVWGVGLMALGAYALVRLLGGWD